MDDLRTLVQIDAQNMYYPSRKKGLKLDYTLLKTKLQRIYGHTLHIVTYLVQSEATTDDTMRFLMQGLNSSGVDVRLKKVIPGQPVDSNHDANIIIDAISSESFFDQLVLFSGDGDFTDLFRSYKEKGKRCHVWAYRGSCSPLLLKYVDSIHILDNETFFVEAL